MYRLHTVYLLCPADDVRLWWESQLAEHNERRLVDRGLYRCIDMEIYLTNCSHTSSSKHYKLIFVARGAGGQFPCSWQTAWLQDLITSSWSPVSGGGAPGLESLSWVSFTSDHAKYRPEEGTALSPEVQEQGGDDWWAALLVMRWPLSVDIGSSHGMTGQSQLNTTLGANWQAEMFFFPKILLTVTLT